MVGLEDIIINTYQKIIPPIEIIIPEKNNKYWQTIVEYIDENNIINERDFMRNLEWLIGLSIRNFPYGKKLLEGSGCGGMKMSKSSLLTTKKTSNKWRV